MEKSGHKIASDFFVVSGRLGEEGVRFVRPLEHALEFEDQALGKIYLACHDACQIALDPRTLREGTDAVGIVGTPGWNSNFSSFPRAPRNGRNPEKYGIVFKFNSIDEMIHGVRELRKKVI